MDVWEVFSSRFFSLSKQFIFVWFVLVDYWFGKLMIARDEVDLRHQSTLFVKLAPSIDLEDRFFPLFGTFFSFCRSVQVHRVWSVHTVFTHRVLLVCLVFSGHRSLCVRIHLMSLIHSYDCVFGYILCDYGLTLQTWSCLRIDFRVFRPIFCSFELFSAFSYRFFAFFAFSELFSAFSYRFSTSKNSSYPMMTDRILWWPISSADPPAIIKILNYQYKRANSFKLSLCILYTPNSRKFPMIKWFASPIRISLI